ncbi:MAG TPA: ABC transporter ATP-binding protein [Thermoplasmata archaeon]|nr:ABC transporter ATP-binding protein [Thermoplasmata archaeon]
METGAGVTGTAPAASLFQTSELSRRFREVEALSAVSLRVGPGAIGLIGPNGAGKTTLIRILLGLLPPSSGSAQVFGLDPILDGLAIRERIGYMPEHDCLLPELTGVGFVAYMGRVSGLTKDHAFQRAHEVLQFVGLAEERYRKLREYSVGMRQRVKLAQALVHDPPLLFLDEPTSGLDPGGRAGMLALLRTLADRPGRSLVLSTHLLGDVERVCDQAVMLNNGALLTVGKLADLKGDGGEELTVRLRGDVEAFVRAAEARGLEPHRTSIEGEVRLKRPAQGEEPIFAAAQDSGSQIRYIGPNVRTMEELFLSLVQRSVPGVRS